MQNIDKAQQYQNAVLAQLNAEIAAKDQTPKSVAAALEIDYNTFRRYLKGERAIPMTILWATLETLELAEDVFVTRARQRFQQQ